MQIECIKRPVGISQQNISRKLASFASCSRELHLTEGTTRTVRANNSREHSHSRECEYLGQNYYANVCANSSRQCETALTVVSLFGSSWYRAYKCA